MLLLDILLSDSGRNHILSLLTIHDLLHLHSISIVFTKINFFGFLRELQIVNQHYSEIRVVNEIHMFTGLRKLSLEDVVIPIDVLERFSLLGETSCIIRGNSQGDLISLMLSYLVTSIKDVYLHIDFPYQDPIYQAFPHLRRYLHLGRNSSVDLSLMTHITHLIIDGTTEKISLSLLTSIRHLSLSRSNVTNFLHMTKVTRLDVNQWYLEGDLANLLSVMKEVKHLQVNGRTSLPPFGYLGDIRIFKISHVECSEEKFVGLSMMRNLREFHLDGTNISPLVISSLTQITHLEISPSYVPISSAIGSLTRLKSLTTDGITSGDLRGLSFLENLVLDEGSGRFPSRVLRNLTNLTRFEGEIQDFRGFLELDVLSRMRNLVLFNDDMRCRDVMEIFRRCTSLEYADVACGCGNHTRDISRIVSSCYSWMIRQKWMWEILPLMRMCQMICWVDLSLMQKIFSRREGNSDTLGEICVM